MNYMKYLNKKQDQIDLILFFNCKEQTTMKFRRNDKIGDILQSYAKKNGVDLNSIFALYKAETIDVSKYKLTLNDIIKKDDSKVNQMIILVYTLDNNMTLQQSKNNNKINIFFILDSNKSDQLEASWENSIKNVCIKYANDKGLDFKLLRFKYGEKIIDLNQKFCDIVNVNDKRCLGMIIAVYTGTPLKIKFLYNNNYFYQDCFKEDKIEDILKIYANTISKEIKDLDFYYNTNFNSIQLDLNQTFSQLINNDESLSAVNLNTKDTFYNSINEITIIVKNKNSTPIYYPTYTPDNKTCCNLKKIIKIAIPILILLTIIAVIIYFSVIRKSNDKKSSSKNETFSSQPEPSDTIDITDIESKSCIEGYFIPIDDETQKDCQKCSLEGCQKCNGTYEKNECYSCGDLLSIYDSNNKIIKCDNICEIGEEEKCLTCYENKTECKSCNLGYTLVKGKCISEYLIKVTYLTLYPMEELDLISISASIYVHKMIIDGEYVSRISRTNTYIFPEKGYHTVYFGFLQGTLFFENYIFYGRERIVSVSFLNFDEYIPAIDFKGMFSKCTNLTSVDLSKISFEMKYRYDFIDMFYDCINLKHVNFNNLFSDDVNNMFYNCISLISVDLSKINPIDTKNAEYMFYNCISLKSINFEGFYLKSLVNMNYMFYNCISLESIDLSDFRPDAIEKMENAFGNCISLTYINFNDFDMKNAKYMDYLFYNCTTLEYINLTNFNTEKVYYLNNMFSYCTSLKSIDLSQFVTNNVKDINSMFSHCYSLESLNLLTFITDNVEDINSMFSHCYSLKNIKFNKKNFLTHNVRNMSSLFSHCYSLTTIDLSNFNTEKVVYLDSMFSHCYSLTSIDLGNFNTKNVEYFDNMFSNCYSLESLNISHLNSKSYISLKNMFSGCYSLTSIDLSNFKNKENPFYDDLFYDCPNLNYVNISTFSSNLRKYQTLFNTNISSNGKLIINEQYYNYYRDLYEYYIPSNWTIIFE